MPLPPRGLSMSAMGKNEMDTIGVEREATWLSLHRDARHSRSTGCSRWRLQPSDPMPQLGCRSKRRLACISASSTHRSGPKRQGRPRVSAASQPEAGRGPQIGLQLSSSGIDLPNLAVIPSFIEQNTLIETVPQQRTHSRRIGRRQKVCPDVLRTDCVGLCCLLKGFLIVPADGHRKAESHDKAEQRQCGGHDNAETWRSASFGSRRLLRREAPIQAESDSATRESPTQGSNISLPGSYAVASCGALVNLQDLEAMNRVIMTARLAYSNWLAIALMRFHPEEELDAGTGARWVDWVTWRNGLFGKFSIPTTRRESSRALERELDNGKK
jgi:hypothetical protein